MSEPSAQRLVCEVTDCENLADEWARTKSGAYAVCKSCRKLEGAVTFKREAQHDPGHELVPADGAKP